MKYHFIGIKGSGMASLATILKDEGKDVGGSDIESFIFTQERLDAKGIPYTGFSKENIKAGMTIIVGNAFDDSNEEVKEAYSRNDVDVYRYHEFLGKLMSTYTSISVAGTHGKTTTTGMLAHVLEALDSTGFLIGDGTGDMPMDSKFFVVESCEYKRHFLSYNPDYAIITNIELDHVDYYNGIEDYVLAYQQFMDTIKKGAVLFGDDEHIRKLKNTNNIETLYFGLEKNNDVQAVNIEESSKGMSFDVLIKGELFGHFTLAIYGKPLLWDTLAVIAIAYMQGMSADAIQDALISFGGVKRRFVVEELGDNVYVDDYAHHPTAIKYLIEALRVRFPDKKIVAVFKPDRYSRIEEFLDGFHSSLSLADSTYICDFPANATREPGVNVTIDDLWQGIRGASLINEDLEGAKVLDKESPACFVFMSSKDIYKLKDMLKNFHNS